MQLRKTQCPDIDIIDQGDGWVEYIAKHGQRWRITGTCNQCGMCELGVKNREHVVFTGEPGTPNACYDIEGENRLDYAVNPEITREFIECSLTGVYL